jgi:pyruvate formate lyase activating enzyme
MDAAMHEAMLYDKLPGAAVRHHGCQWQCLIAAGAAGVCRMYQNREGVLYSLDYALASSVAADPVEKKPLYHFYPGSQVFSLGSWGCNFHCPHCQNWQISCVNVDQIKRASQEVSPQAAVELAVEYGCQGIAWTYNEPTMWLEYTLDTARLTRAAGLYTVYVTNGYATPEALDALGPWLDAWRVDVKGFSDDFYLKFVGVPSWRGILTVAERARHKWGMHVEVVTNVIPTLNDDDTQLAGLANWISTALGPLTPWHVTRFYPQHELLDKPATPLATLLRARELGRQAGLKFVYLGNVAGTDGEDTVCYHCQSLVVRRAGYHTETLNLDGARCRVCGTDLNFRPA